MPLTSPKVTHQADSEEWYFSWPDQPNSVGKLVLAISNLKESSAGIHGDLELASVDDRHIYGPKTLNLKGANAARDVVNILSERTKGDIDNGGIPKEWWALILEQVTHQVLTDHRQGSPLIRLSETEDPGPARFAVDKLLPEDANTVIAADGGSNKGNFAVHLAICWAIGKPLAGKYAVHSDGRRGVFYADWEDDREEASRRFYMASRGYRLNGIPSSITYRSMYRGVREELSQLRAIIRQENIGLVIIDSIAGAAAGKLVDDDVAQGTMGALRRLSPANRFIIAHVSHASARGEHRDGVNIFGSVFFRNHCRMFWEFQSEGEGEEYRLALVQRKINRGPKLSNEPGLGFTLTFNDSLGESFLSPGDVRDVTAAMGHSDLRFRMAEALREANRPMTTSQLAEAVAANINSVRTAAKREAERDKPLLVNLGRAGGEMLWGPATNREN